MNSVNIIGRLVGETKTDRTTNGTVVLNNAIRINKKVNGEKVRQYFDFFRFGSTAEMIEKYFEKGDEIAITGELTQRSFIGKNDGKRHSKIEIHVITVSFTNGKKSGRPDPETSGFDRDEFTDATINTEDGDLPF